MPFYTFLGEGSPTKLDDRKKLVPTYSNLKLRARPARRCWREREREREREILTSDDWSFGAFCLAVRTLTFCQLMGFPYQTPKSYSLLAGEQISQPREDLAEGLVRVEGEFAHVAPSPGRKSKARAELRLAQACGAAAHCVSLRQGGRQVEAGGWLRVDKLVCLVLSFFFGGHPPKNACFFLDGTPK